MWNPDDIIDGDGAGDDDDQEDGMGPGTFNGRDGVIYVIDCAENITGDSDTFRYVLECIEAGMLNRIIVSDRDLLGIVFYNTEHSPPAKDINTTIEGDIITRKNTAVFLPMKSVTKESIQYIKNFKESEDFFDLKSRYGTSTNENFTSMLWLCSRMFTRCGYKLQSSTIVLFTNNDEPYTTGSRDFQTAFIEANGLNKLGVHFILVPMCPDDDTFDDSKFYREFLCTITDQDPDTFQLTQPSQIRAMLLNRVFQRDYRRACLRYFNFTISDKLAISCGIYGFSKRTSMPRSVHLLRDTNQVVVSKRSHILEELNEAGESVPVRRILPGELRKYQRIGGEKIIFSPEELAQTKSIMAPGMKLLGFKPISHLPVRAMVKSTRLLYPYEGNIKGSECLFRALWQKCIEKEKFALCVFAQIRKVAPRYVALVPQTQDNDGCDGFKIVYLPMQTDIRKLNIFDDAVPELPADGSALFHKIVKKLKFKYDPLLFQNPQLKIFYSNLEALVFEGQEVDTEDTTLPNTKMQDEKIDKFIDEITEIFGTECAVAEKRKASGGGGGGGVGGSAAKIPKGSTLNRTEMIATIADGTIQSLTVQNLKDFLMIEGIGGLSKLKKSELIDAVKNRLNE